MILTGKTKVLGAKPVLLLSVPQISHGLDQLLNLGLHGERLVTSHQSNGMSLDANHDKQSKWRNRMAKNTACAYCCDQYKGKRFEWDGVGKNTQHGRRMNRWV